MKFDVLTFERSLCCCPNTLAQFRIAHRAIAMLLCWNDGILILRIFFKDRARLQLDHQPGRSVFLFCFGLLETSYQFFDFFLKSQVFYCWLCANHVVVNARGLLTTLKCVFFGQISESHFWEYIWHIIFDNIREYGIWGDLAEFFFRDSYLKYYYWTTLSLNETWRNPGKKWNVSTDTKKVNGASPQPKPLLSVFGGRTPKLIPKNTAFIYRFRYISTMIQWKLKHVFTCEIRNNDALYAPYHQ